MIKEMEMGNANKLADRLNQTTDYVFSGRITSCGRSITGHKHYVVSHGSFIENYKSLFTDDPEGEVLNEWRYRVTITPVLLHDSGLVSTSLFELILSCEIDGVYHNTTAIVNTDLSNNVMSVAITHALVELKVKAFSRYYKHEVQNDTTD